MREIKQIEGRGIILSGDDIDTDRIVPARFLKSIVFSGLEKSVFIDDRKALKDSGSIHPFDDERFQGANILFVNKNFGCGSSREHAPQAIHRWGIQAIIGESFSEIFFSNCVSIGVPCFTLKRQEILETMNLINKNPKIKLMINLEQKLLLLDRQEVFLTIDDGIRNRFTTGEWNPTQILLKNSEVIKKKYEELPYLHFNE